MRNKVVEQLLRVRREKMNQDAEQVFRVRRDKKS